MDMLISPKSIYALSMRYPCPVRTSELSDWATTVGGVFSFPVMI